VRVGAGALLAGSAFIELKIVLKKALGRRYFSETYTLAHLDRFLAKRQIAALTPTAFGATSRERTEAPDNIETGSPGRPLAAQAGPCAMRQRGALAYASDE
jgi:hypothetical protein